MATYNSVGAYSSTAAYPAFYGLMQYGDGNGTDPRFAVEAVNAETPAGALQPLGEPALLQGADLPAPIETLALLHRRWYADPQQRDLLVASSAGKLYARVANGGSWTALEMPAGITAFQGNDWSWVTYEINPEGSEAPVDVLLLSNAIDGMFMLRGDNLTLTAVETPKKFGVIERYAERIWGGAIIGDPDMLVYSAPYDPTDWKAQTEIPEDGAGDLLQPSWDGDSFTALRAFGSQLIAFKKTRVWRILGTDPGEYVFKEQYGGGMPYANTIVVDAERIFAMTDRGVVIYDGSSVAAFQQQSAEDVFARMNRASLDKACACMWRDRYFCAIPLDGATECNAVLVYNSVDGTWLLHDAISVSAFLPTEDALYFTSPTSPSSVFLWNEDSWASGEPSKAVTRWVTPWNDLGCKNVTKGAFELYLLPEVQDRPVVLRISLQTEKWTKTRFLRVTPASWKGVAWPDDLMSGWGGPLHSSEKQFAPRRLRFNGSARRFRIIIESEENSAPWRIVGGMALSMESDAD